MPEIGQDLLSHDNFRDMDAESPLKPGKFETNVEKKGEFLGTRNKKSKDRITIKKGDPHDFLSAGKKRKLGGHRSPVKKKGKMPDQHSANSAQDRIWRNMPSRYKRGTQRVESFERN